MPPASATRREAERHRLRTALDALTTGVVLADRDGVLQVRNTRRRRLRRPRGGAPPVGRRGAAARRVERHGRRRGRSSSPVRPGGCCILQAEPLADGFALATIDDVSERARLDAVRTDFVANISHELKTPVGALAVLAEAASDSDDPEVVRRLTARMVDEAHRAARTIDDLLELSRIELGGEALQGVVDVHEVLARRRRADRSDGRRSGRCTRAVPVASTRTSRRSATAASWCRRWPT